MDKRSSRDGNRQKRERDRRERQKKENQGAREGRKVANSVFSQSFVAPEDRKVGSLKRRVRSHLVSWQIKNCTLLLGFWRNPLISGMAAKFFANSVVHWTRCINRACTWHRKETRKTQRMTRHGYTLIYKVIVQILTTFAAYTAARCQASTAASLLRCPSSVTRCSWRTSGPWRPCVTSNACAASSKEAWWAGASPSSLGRSPRTEWPSQLGEPEDDGPFVPDPQDLDPGMPLHVWWTILLRPLDRGGEWRWGTRRPRRPLSRSLGCQCPCPLSRCSMSGR